MTGARRSPRGSRDSRGRGTRPTPSKATSAASGAPQKPAGRVRFAPPLHAPVVTKLASKSGYLRKQADNEPGKWTKYFFVLKSSTYLFYYNTPDALQPRGVIDLEFLNDVRFNSECLQRGVGGSEHCFRVTGQFPPELSESGDGKTKLRPLYLDTDSKEDADAWMDAIINHRFDLERDEEFVILLNSMEDLDNRMTAMKQEAKDAVDTASQVLQTAREYLCKLRDVDPEDEGGRPRGMTDAEEDGLRTVLSCIELMLEEIYAEADQRGRQIAILRNNEDELKEKESDQKKRVADFKAQSERLKDLEVEVEMWRKKVDKQQLELEKLTIENDQLACTFKERSKSLTERELALAAREKDLEKRSRRFDKECNQKLKEREHHLEVQRRALEKEATRQERQKKELEKKHKLVDKKLKSRQSTLTTNALQRNAADDVDESEMLADTNQAHANGSHAVETKPKSMFKKPRFLKKKPTNTKSADVAVRDSAHRVSGVDDGERPPSDVTDADWAPEEVYIDDRSSRASSALFTASEAEGSSRRRTLPASLFDGRSSSLQERTQRAASLTTPKSVSQTLRLPDHWIETESKSHPGEVYFYNRQTGETRWERPMDDSPDGRGMEKSEIEKTDPTVRELELELRKHFEQNRSGTELRESCGFDAPIIELNEEDLFIMEERQTEPHPVSDDEDEDMAAFDIASNTDRVTERLSSLSEGSSYGDDDHCHDQGGFDTPPGTPVASLLGDPVPAGVTIMSPKAKKKRMKLWKGKLPKLRKKSTKKQPAQESDDDSALKSRSDTTVSDDPVDEEVDEEVLCMPSPTKKKTGRVWKGKLIKKIPKPKAPFRRKKQSGTVKSPQPQSPDLSVHDELSDGEVDYGRCEF